MMSNGIPITIGIVGHRDLRLEDIPRVRAQIHDIVLAYRMRYPCSPISLLTALAEGADQLAVEACADLDFTLIAVLPMEQVDYERDFETAEALEHFRLLLAAADRTYVVPRNEVSVRVTDQTERDLAYERCSRFISQNSHVLIAVWDGLAPELIGGTGDTVHFRLNSSDSILGAFADVTEPRDEMGVTIHIPAGRRRHDRPPVDITGKQCALTALTILDAGACKPWSDQDGDATATQIEWVNRHFTESAGTNGLMNDAVMALGDRLAARYQTRFRRLSGSILIAGVCTLLAVNFAQNLTSRWLLASLAITALVTAGLWWTLSRLKLKSRFQVLRALAEGARVQQVWTANAVIGSVADHYLLTQPEVGWIRRILRTSHLCDLTRPADCTPVPGGPKVEEWMHGQVDYFLGPLPRGGAIGRNARRARKYRIMTVVGAAIALVGLIPEVLRHLSESSASAWLSIADQGLWELGLGVAAAAAAYSELMAFREVGRQYQASVEVFRLGLMDLSKADRFPAPDVRRADITRWVGVEALRETSYWLSLNYDRSVRPV